MKKSTMYAKMLVDLLITLFVVFVICYFGPKAVRFFLPFVVGWIIAMIADPIVRFMEKHLKVVRKFGSMFIIIAALGLVVLLGYFLIAALVEQIIGLAGDLPRIYEIIKADVDMIGQNMTGMLEKLPADVQKSISEATKDLNQWALSGISSLSQPTIHAAGNFAKNLPSMLISFIVTLLSSYFFIAEREEIMEGLRKITPESVKEKMALISGELKRAVGGYFKAQFKIMGVVALILFVGFLILQYRYAVLLAVIIAFLDFLPFFGTGTALIPWALFEFLSGDYKRTVGLLIIYGVSQLVRQLIQPKLVGDSMGLKPLPTLFFIFIGYKLGGVPGMIVAVPIGMIVINLYKAGVFDSFISNVKMIVSDINQFRKM